MSTSDVGVRAQDSDGAKLQKSIADAIIDRGGRKPARNGW